MHVLVQAIETLVVALAATAFAHFGVSLKDAPPAPSQPSVVRRLPVAAVQTPEKPCPDAQVRPV